MNAENRRLFVGGLAWAVNNDILNDVFGEYGELTFARVYIDRETGKSKGFGFVEFVNLEDSLKAKEALDGSEIEGRAVRVDFAIDKNQNKED